MFEPCVLPLGIGDEVHQLVVDLETAHDGHKVIGSAQVGVALRGDDACRRVVTEGERAGKHASGQLADTLHSGDNLVAVGSITCALPFGHPVTGVCQPVGAYTQTCGRGAGIFVARLGKTHRVEGIELLVVIPYSGHQVAATVVGCKVVHEAVEGSLADTRLLGAASPVAHVVTATKAGIVAEVVYVDLAHVTTHSLGHAPDILAACAEEAVPQPQVRAKFGVIPRIAADVVFPFVAHGVVGVHEVAIMPEAIPAVLLYSVLIEIDVLLETVFDLGTIFGRTVRQTPDTKGAAVVEVFRRRQYKAGSIHRSGIEGKLLFTAIALAGVEDEGRSAGHTVGGAHAFLHVLVGCKQVVGLVVVVTEVHRLRLRAPKPRGDGGHRCAGTADLEGRGI